MDFLRSFGSTPVVLAVAGVLFTLFAVTMGLFSNNQMPVEGKVRKALLPGDCQDEPPADCCVNRQSSSQEAPKEWVLVQPASSPQRVPMSL